MLKVHYPVPEFSVALSFVFKKYVTIEKISDEIQNLGIERPKVIIPKSELFADSVCVNIVIIKNERFWELDTVLTEMFARIDDKLPQLKILVEQYEGRIVLDIAFYQYGLYPAISISSENIRKIACLNAEIGIDSY